jgi:hypothetical protein
MSSSGGATALRKHLLVMRAAVERAELAQTVQDVRHGLRWTALLKGAVPGIAATQGLPLLGQLLRRYPVASTALSFVASRFKPRTSMASVLRIAILAGLAWQVWQLSRAFRGRRSATRGARARRTSQGIEPS